MYLSVIIPTRNRATCLDATLASLTRQTFPPDAFEIVVIDNASVDSTRAICNKYKNSFCHFRCSYVEEPGLHNGRHKGLSEAVSDILVYADDDIEAFPTWLEAIHHSFSDQDVVLVGGKILPKFVSPPPAWLLRRWNAHDENGQILGPLSILDFGDEIREISPDCVYGCNFSIRKEILLRAGGFHPDAMPKELIMFRGDGESHVSQFIKNSGMKAIYNPEASVYHLVSADRMTIAYFCQRNFNQGISDSFTYIRSSRQINSEILTKYRLKFDLYAYLINKFNILIDDDQLIDDIVDNCYVKGYRYHSRLAQQDTSLFDWVVKATYF